MIQASRLQVVKAFIADVYVSQFAEKPQQTIGFRKDFGKSKKEIYYFKGKI